MIRDMVRIAVWGIMTKRASIIRRLHDLSVLHIDNLPQDKLTSKEIDSLNLLRNKVLGMLEALEWKGWNFLEERDLESARKGFDLPLEEAVREVNSSLDDFLARLSSILGERDSLNGYLLSLEQAHDSTYHFKTFLKQEAELNRSVSLWWVPIDDQSKIITMLAKELKEFSPDSREELLRYQVARKGKNKNIISVSAPRYDGHIVERIMESHNAVRWKPPASIESSPHGIYSTVTKIEQELVRVPERLTEISEEIIRTRKQWGPKLGSLFILADEKLEELQVEADTVEKERFFFIEGWIPEYRLNETTAALKDSFGKDVLIRWRYPSSAEWQRVPTALYNWGIFRPFEVFLKLMQSPGYKSSDPTPFIAIFFPFFSGCMVGDIGYGLIAMVIGILMYRKKASPLVSDLGFILMAVSLWSIFWGFTYGEFFGDVGHRLFHMEPLWVERSQAVMPVLVFTISLGFAHVVLGLLLGIYQGLRIKSHHLWMEKAGNLIILFGLLGILVVFKGWLPDALFTLSISMLIIGLVLLVIGGGIGGLVESFSSIGNILSYVRIAAIGLSSAILAVVASRFIDVFGISILGIFLALTIHVLNFVLALGGSSLHSARLHYVEFMGKFYSGGGSQYKPFSRRRGRDWKKH